MQFLSKNTPILIISLALGSVLSGCGLTPYEELKSTDAQSGQFSKTLAREYEAFALSEIQQYDWLDQHYIATKGLKAAKGQQPLPEETRHWRLSDDNKKLMSRYRNDLIHWLNTDARQTDPNRSAKAQARFDCWLEQQEENWQDDDIKACKRGLQSALPRISKIHFSFNASQLDEQALQVIEEVVLDWRHNPGKLILVQGHTDKIGSKSYNYKLARKRAFQVKETLVAYGIPSDHIQVETWGKTRPRQESGPALNNQFNRRVEILKL